MRFGSTQAIHLDDQINKDLENEVYKPKSHPGRVRMSIIELPEAIRDAIRTGVNGENWPLFQIDSILISNSKFSLKL